MAVKELVTKVWIDPGCIVCDACETTSPKVFEVKDEVCIIRPEALDAEFTKPLASEIVQAAEECPVDVIKFETVKVEVAEPAPAAKAAAPGDPEAATASRRARTVPDAPAGPVDPALDALLKAVTARGGKAGIDTSSTQALGALDRLGQKRFEELPPDAQYARVMQSSSQVQKASPEADEVTRREFINKGALIVGWGTLAVAGGVASGPAFARFMMPNVLEEPDPKVSVGAAEKYRAMNPGAVNEDFKGQGIWIIRLEDRIAALSTTCTHLGCIPNWLENDRKFKCPCHGSGFKQTGINYEGPAPRPLERFSIQLVDAVVVVDRGSKFLQEKGHWTNPDSFLLV